MLTVSTTTAVIPPEFYSGVGKRENEGKNQKGKNVKNVKSFARIAVFSFRRPLEEDDIFASIRGTIEEEEEEEEEEVVNIKV